MPATYKILDLKDINQNEEEQSFALDILLGLSQNPKKISSRYFYDKEGSELFTKITELPEYYLTKCEFEIMEKYKEQIADLVSGEAFNLIELGPGDGRKTNVLLKHFLGIGLNFQYIPIDISEASMKDLVISMNNKFSNLNTHGLVTEYFSGIKWLNENKKRKNLILFMGSNIGNFNASHARAFLRSLWNSLNNDDYILIGFDLKKDIDLMLNAYNDSQGITSSFNMNLLKRINKELGGNFDIEKFRHFSNYDVYSGAIESYLISTEKQIVFLKELGQEFSFQAWEPMHTEYSYKYLESDIELLAKETGFTIEKQFYDSKNYFVDSIWKVNKISR